MELAAKTIREAQYLIRAGEADADAFVMLSGLATAASAARSGELAREVRILARVIRRRSRAVLSPVNELRILMIAAAAFEELNAWSTFVGEWVTELSFDDITHEDAKIFVISSWRIARYRTTSMADMRQSASCAWNLFPEMSTAFGKQTATGRRKSFPHR